MPLLGHFQRYGSRFPIYLCTQSHRELPGRGGDEIVVPRTFSAGAAGGRLVKCVRGHSRDRIFRDIGVLSPRRVGQRHPDVAHLGDRAVTTILPWAGRGSGGAQGPRRHSAGRLFCAPPISPWAALSGASKTAPGATVRLPVDKSRRTQAARQPTCVGRSLHSLKGTDHPAFASASR